MKRNIFLLTLICFVFVSIAAQAQDVDFNIKGKTVEADLYGKAHASMDILDDGEDSSFYVSSNSSRVGLKGKTEVVADSLDIVWQVESLVNLDEGGSTFATRNSYLGLAGNWGTAFVGRHDTPFKTIARKVDLFGDRSGDSRNIMGVGGSGWNRRASNLVLYATPDMSGFQGVFAYIAEDGVDQADMFSMSLTYKYEALWLSAAFETHGEGVTATDGVLSAEEEVGFRIAAAYDFDFMKLVAIYESLTDLGGVADMDIDTWGVGVSGNIDDHNVLKFQVYSTDGVDDSSDQTTTLFAAGWDHLLTDSATIYLMWAGNYNDDAANLGIGGGGHGDSIIPALGDDATAISLGMIYNF